MIENTVLYTSLIVSSIFLVFIATLFSYLIIMRLIQNRRERIINNYIKALQKDWYHYLVLQQDIKHIQHHRTPSKYEKLAIDRIFLSYTSLVNNEQVINRISKYTHLNFKNHYKKMLTNKKWGVRMNALQRLIDFKLEFLLPEIEQTIKSNKTKSLEEYLLMLKILSLHNQNLFLSQFYKPAYKMNEFEYKEVLASLDASYLDIFMTDFEQLSKTLQLALLEYLSTVSSMNPHYIEFFESLLDHPETEYRIRTLKSISRLGIVKSTKKYLAFAQSEDWEERLMLAKVLLHAKPEDASFLLKQLLHDTSWWVRKQAATTLSQLKYGVTILKEVTEQSEDRYATEMAKEILQMEQ